jgi:signal transduction histidine kinase
VGGDMNLVPVDIVSIVTDEVREGKLVAAARHIDVTQTNKSEGPIFVCGSTPHLKSLFSNLIQNAIAYSLDDTGRVQVSVQVSDQRVLVEISDNGIGIPEKNLSKIFDEHFRSKDAVAHNPSGSGLGLSIVKEIVRLHGATINVESTVGNGTSFTVSFDVKEPKQEEEENGKRTHS